jgi:biopolymer transport protein ExbD
VQVRKGQSPGKEHLIIQADKRMDYTQISPVLQAGAHAGFQKFKFAVLQEGVQR